MSHSDILEAAALQRGWGTAPLWTIARRIDRTGFPDAELLSVYREWGVVRKADRDDNFNVESDDLSSYKFVRCGDLVLNKMKTWQGSLGVSEYEGIVSPAYFTCELSSTVSPRFIHYLLRSDPYIAMYAAASKGIRPNQWDLPYEEFRSLRVLLPPLEEQRRIADFLDDQVSLIHTVMEARDRQNALLRLEVQTEISELVLGAESKRVQLRRLIQRRPDYGANAAAEFENREWPRFIRTTDIAADGGLREETFRSLPPEVAEDYLLEDGDVLFTRSGSVGKSFIYRQAWGPAAFAGYLIRVSTDRSKLLPEWLKAFAETDSYWAQIRESAIQATISNVNAERYSGLMLPVPPLIEQEKRIVHVQRVQELAQARNDALDRSGRLMEEFRSAMITAAVTGELDVTTARRGIPA